MTDKRTDVVAETDGLLTTQRMPEAEALSQQSTLIQPERHTTSLWSPSCKAQCAAGCLRVYMDRRINRLERFLQRALPGHVFGDIR
jgi:hypothetical protein